MHELGLLDAMLKTVDGIMAKETDVSTVSRITVEVGELSGAVPKFLYDCWDAVRDGTKYADTELVVKMIPGTAKCVDCGAEFRIDLDTMRCPKCGGGRLAPLTGRDMTITEIEAS
jgi:hydrogenase nickel incorporation protein HypA/HybF